MSTGYTPPEMGRRQPPRLFSRAPSVLFFMVQLGYGAVLARTAIPRRSDPRWMGLGALGFSFAVAAVLFIVAQVSPIRGASTGRRWLLVGASVLMLSGAVSLVVGFVAGH